jgi:hypothetical protein
MWGMARLGTFSQPAVRLEARAVGSTVVAEPEAAKN